MKKLLTALVAVGLCVGCGGDTSAAKKETKISSSTSTPSGTVKKEETKKEEVKETKKDK